MQFGLTAAMVRCNIEGAGPPRQQQSRSPYPPNEAPKATGHLHVPDVIIPIRPLPAWTDRIATGAERCSYARTIPNSSRTFLVSLAQMSR